MIQYIEEKPDIDSYLALRDSVHFHKLTRDQAQRGLDNSLYILTAREEDRLVGMGRIVGDGAVICYVQDLMIRPEVQGRGIGGRIIEDLKAYVRKQAEPGTTVMLDLMCAAGREAFYKKHGFFARPARGLGPGMMMLVKPAP